MAATGAFVSSVGDCVWNLLKWSYAWIRSDHGAAALHLHKAKDALSGSAFIDNAAFCGLAEITRGVVQAFAPMILPAVCFTGPWAAATMIGLFVLGQVAAAQLHKTIDIRNSWIPWAKGLLGYGPIHEASWVHPLQMLVRTSDVSQESRTELNDYLQSMEPDELCCGILATLVYVDRTQPMQAVLIVCSFDPVRHKTTGQLYERAAVKRWIEGHHSTDPITRHLVSMADYVEAPVSKAAAHAIAKQLGYVAVAQ